MTVPNRLQSTGYYYAHGRRVPLEADPDHVAVDLGRATAHQIYFPLEELRGSLSLLPGGRVAVVPSTLIPKDTLTGLRSIGALQPVYRSSGARLVTYPEVRVALQRGQRE